MRNKMKKLDLLNIEKRFKTVTGISYDIDVFPLENKVDFNTDKGKSKEFAEVFTPLNIVDKMILTIPHGGMTDKTKNLDMCAGHGQFSVRMLRKLNNDYNLDIVYYLKNYHYFNEIQIESCYKLMYIFGSYINLSIGDAMKLGELPYNHKGIWYYLDNNWFNVTNFVRELYEKFSNEYDINEEKIFVKKFKEGIR